MKKSFLAIPVFFATFTGLHATEPKGKTVGPLTFENQVRPILKAHCFECHGEGKKLKGKLDLRLRRLMIAGGDSGPAIVPGQADKSLLVERLRSQEMPPGKRKLTKDEMALIERWIAEGGKTLHPEPKALAVGFQISEQEQGFWSFQAIRRPKAPQVKDTQRVRTPIDAFLLARLEEKGLSFSVEADRRTLIRRVCLDLTGLPPAPDEVAEFLADTAPDAYERLVDRLLASPRYGERWGRHWLDVAGYADSEGYGGEDTVRATAYRYRDYVIRSFNADKPFDQFIIEQLAGDELLRPPYDKIAPADLDKLIATGFLRMAPDGTASPEADPSLARNQVIADTVQIVSTSLFGLTVQCAQCHNHRYDPIPQLDYYRMRAIFEPALDWKNWRTPAAREVVVLGDPERKKAAEIEQQAVRIDRERLKKQEEYIERTFQKEVGKLPEELRDKARTARATPAAKRIAEQVKLLADHPSLNVTAGSLYLYDAKAAADLKAYQGKSSALRATKPVGESVRALTEVPGKIPTTFLFERGDHVQPKDAVAPGGLTILRAAGLDKLTERANTLPTTGRRLAFARSLVSGKHPLTARVLVNRVWMNHFGKGIVGTPGDFGFLGERPTHPELLDWLASEFMDGGWKLKRLHKTIVTSTAYRQSSRRTDDLQKSDPDNCLLGRMAVRRLEAEAIRDAVLAVSGKLNAKPFGPPVPIAFDELGQIVVGVDTTDAAGRPTGKKVSLNGEEYRRSIYVQARRSRPLAALETFDGAVMSPNCELRAASTVTPQALMLMNSRFIHDQAEFFAERVRKDAGKNTGARVARAWRLAFASEPTRKQTDDAIAFLNDQAARFRAGKGQDAELRSLTNFCQALLSANAFLYVD